MNERYPIPARLNVAIAAAQMATLAAILALAAFATNGWAIAGLALAYGIVMNSGYAMMHEAEHNLLHPNPVVNEAFGVALGFFFPAPFHLMRQGHLGHHMRNRSDDEAFDFYFEGENPLWKRLQLYGILTGLFWVVIVLGVALAAIWPRALSPRASKLWKFDRPTEALIETLNPKYLRWIQLEAIGIIAFHSIFIFALGSPPLRHFAVLFGFGFIWSAMQYVHHFGTARDVRTGARNLRTLSLLDALWLNHNWHLNHHLNPTVPWIHLPQAENGNAGERGGLVRSYLKMWRGPRKTAERVQNRYAGKIIR